MKKVVKRVKCKVKFKKNMTDQEWSNYLAAVREAVEKE